MPIKTLDGSILKDFFICAGGKKFTSQEEWEEQMPKCSPECEYETCEYRLEHMR